MIWLKECGLSGNNAERAIRLHEREREQFVRKKERERERERVQDEIKVMGPLHKRKL